MTKICPACSKFKPHMVMVLGQTGATFSYFISQASFNQGMDPKIYVTYRLLIGCLAVFPFAYFIERNQRPKLTVALFGEISALSLLGTCIPMNLFFASMKCTSPAFVSVVNNTIAAIVFILAVLLRMEHLDIKSPHGMAKLLGTVLSLAGVTVMTLYKGLELSTFDNAPFHIAKCKVHVGEPIKGSLIAIASCISLSLSYILQGKTLQRYPAQLSLVVWMNMIGGLMSATFAGLTEQSAKPWVIGLDIKLAAVLYGGLVGSGFLIFVQLWCTKVKGPVFMTIFNPLASILSAFVAYFLVGDSLYMGSIIGGSIVVLGLYLLLWGKQGEEDIDLDSSTSYTLLSSSPK